MTQFRHLEDFAPGQRFENGSITLDEAAMIAFAQQFDPQPFHTEPEAAERSFFKGLAASGWHTAAATMRLFLGAGLNVAWGLIGRQVETLEWPRPTRPGDTLRIACEVLEVRASRSRPEMGIVRIRTETFNQRDEIVQRMVTAIVVPVKATAGG
ncbi:MaoC family dehydratase [Arenibaculum pallidiluteum]|uniref:MaoC family dehydratase n=1 Tax=Arenibaculum pallidiluteum TaxID=2812559 RepID=UPI001A97C791|nr:MaoC family dehydratase [Arenibaculum pallidiluteum]